MLNSVILLVAVVLFIISNTAEGGQKKRYSRRMCQGAIFKSHFICFV